MDPSLFFYMDFDFREIRYLFTNSMFCVIISVIWIPCTNSVVLIGIFTAYICMYFILASICVSACVPVYILLFKNELCMYVFIVRQYLFQLIFIVEFDPILNKDYLIYLILFYFKMQSNGIITDGRSSTTRTHHHWRPTICMIAIAMNCFLTVNIL